MSPAPSRAARDSLARRAHDTARVLLIYGLLLGGAVVFSLPFAWMIGTSFKVDREMFAERITPFPMRPVPASASPYLDEHYFREPDPQPYARVRAAIEQRILETGLDLPAGTRGLDRAPEILGPGLYERLQALLSASAWQAADEELHARALAAVTSNLVAEAAAKVYRRLSVGAVRVRSHDLQEADVTEDLPLAEFWQVSGGAPAALSERVEGTTRYADLAYDFQDRPQAQLTLSRTIELPFPAERLFRIQVFLRPDDSWHRMDFFLEKGGRRFRGMRPEYLGNFQWGVVTLQEYGPDDESNKIRLWIPLEEVEAGPTCEAAPDRVKLTLVLRRTSQAGAWWAKCRRNYRGALDYIPFWRYTATSAFLVILNILGNIFACSLVAYAFARLQWPGRTFSFGLMLATMMIPPQITMIPYFLIVRHLGWYNTLKPLWIVSFFGNAFNIFLLRQFMKGIPQDLEDAARIDGCHFLQVYWYVIMPLIKPTLACIAIFTFMGVWNDFMGPLIYLSDQRLYPLSLGLYAFNVQAGANYGMMMAGSLLMTMPVIVIFFFAQKYFIQGVTLTGMKG
ncbi:MAG: carbohydrate ABC transporter permease [Kiritimatiellae bacterium]|nr:carbohydrate ABC transporter permease [Kiritimatiellia bacterium]